jgi:hypothetical protein
VTLVAAIVNPEDLAKKQIFLILVSAANMRQRNIELIKEISSLGYHMIVITTNFPYSVLTKLYSESGIDPKSVSFIDTVTRNSVGSAENIPRVVRYVNNPTNLTDLGHRSHGSAQRKYRGKGLYPVRFYQHDADLPGIS